LDSFQVLEAGSCCGAERISAAAAAPAAAPAAPEKNREKISPIIKTNIYTRTFFFLFFLAPTQDLKELEQLLRDQLRAEQGNS